MSVATEKARYIQDMITSEFMLAVKSQFALFAATKHYYNKRNSKATPATNIERSSGDCRNVSRYQQSSLYTET